MWSGWRHCVVEFWFWMRIFWQMINVWLKYWSKSLRYGKKFCLNVDYNIHWIQECVCECEWVGEWVSEPVNQPVSKWVNKQTSQSVHQSVTQWVSEPASQPINQSVSRAVCQSVNESVSQSTSLSSSQSVNQSVCNLGSWWGAMQKVRSTAQLVRLQWLSLQYHDYCAWFLVALTSDNDARNP